MITDKAKKWYEQSTVARHPWEEVPFTPVYKMTNDARGAFGEHLISDAIHSLGWDIQMDVSDQSNHTDGHYDIKARNKRIEIKTSCLSVSLDKKTNHYNATCWQHEPLYAEDVCDFVIFLDFHFDHIYITVVRNDELPLGKDSRIFEKKHGTLRKNKDDGYKLDFSTTTIRSLVNAGRCKRFDEYASTDDIAMWIQEVFNDLL